MGLARRHYKTHLVVVYTSILHRIFWSHPFSLPKLTAYNWYISMDFNSPIFLFLFLPLFVLTYYIVGSQAKPFVGILGSLIFYSWGYFNYVPLMLGLVCLSFYLALGIDRWRDQRISLILLWAGSLVAVFLLIGFKLWSGVKYPLGLSYVTFQVIAYLIDVYNRKVGCEKNFIYFSFYLLLFPKIPVGPITRYGQLYGQICNAQVKHHEMAEGLRRFMVGFAKKALIADTLAKVVTPIFNLSTPTIAPSTAWLVIIGYSLQIFFDFSGYVDMAIGIGRMMGFRFVENFNFPYLSKNIGEFWRRWHISLSSWFRDFVFYPLERRRLRWLGQPVNIILVFLLTGLWHGISINYVIWGLIHGFALVFESTSLGRRLRNLWTPLQHLYALGVILAGWVFFRSPTPHFALVFLRRLLGDARGLAPLPFELTSPLPFIEPTFIIAILAGLLFVFPVGQWVDGFLNRVSSKRSSAKIVVQVVGDLMLIFIFLLSVAVTAGSTFTPGIYGAF